MTLRRGNLGADDHGGEPGRARDDLPRRLRFDAELARDELAAALQASCVEDAVTH